MTPPRQLPTRPLGKDGPQVPRLGLGLMGLSIAYGSVPSDEERLKFLDRAWELGETFWDSSIAYGDSEDLIGRWFKLHPERRQDIFLATKFGIKGATQQGDGTWAATIDSSPEYCREACEISLKRLGVEYIDLYYVHRFDGKTPVEKTMEALVDLKKQGKIKAIGFSECSSDTLRRGHAAHPVAAVQIEYSPWTLDIERETGTHLLKTCRELGVAVVPYSPLGRGSLPGRYKSRADLEETDARQGLPRFSDENLSKNLEITKIFEDVAAKKQCTAAQAMLAWILSQGDDFFPIPGTKSPQYLEQNLGALDVEIGPQENAQIRELIASMGGAAGHRGSVGISWADTPAL